MSQPDRHLSEVCGNGSFVREYPCPFERKAAIVLCHCGRNWTSTSFPHRIIGTSA
ncbi:hypothetical protein PILCRDRAFT_822307 [Piloderma croceum F 1598]|uniref:Uncharacterized protein n=1 Tax=Piloderma croceum (strain F 1598) TaxID=765440 RepID=A0A0C3F7C7_PILCF|nr:hypothetical protein PILCRDRAFT_822307 [Piloderma croceum F 1598]